MWNREYFLPPLPPLFFFSLLCSPGSILFSPPLSIPPLFAKNLAGELYQLPAGPGTKHPILCTIPVNWMSIKTATSQLRISYCSSEHGPLQPTRIWCYDGCRMFDPTVDLVTAKWSAFDKVTWLMPLLSELSDWRRRLDVIHNSLYTSTNDTDVVFVADFPGSHLSEQ